MLTINKAVIKNFICHLTIVMMICASFATISVANSSETFAYEKIVKVKVSETIARSGAGTTYAKKATLTKGTVKLVKGSKKDKKKVTWYKVYVGKKAVYISSKDVNIISLSVTKMTTKKAVVNTSSGKLYGRTGPASLYPAKKTFKKGTILSVNGKAKDVNGNLWYRVKVGSKYYYVYSKYIAWYSATKSAATAATTAATTTTAKATTAAKATTTTAGMATTTTPGAATTTTPGAATTTTPGTTTTNSTEPDIKFTVTKVSDTVGIVTVSSGSLYVRKGPATGYSALGGMVNGTQFTVTGKTTVSGILWYQLTHKGNTGYVCGTYVKTGSLSELQARQKKARQAAVDWAIDIANDNSFHYGETAWAHKSGCYFCGTQSAKVKAGATAAMAAKTYCCNPFVTAAYNHGAGAPEIDCKVAAKRINLANDSNKALEDTTSFEYISKPSSYSSLQVGDILLTPTHCMLYAGNGKVVHAAHHDNGVQDDYWNSSIVYGALSSNQWSRTTKIYRYIGTGKF